MDNGRITCIWVREERNLGGRSSQYVRVDCATNHWDLDAMKACSCDEDYEACGPKLDIGD